MAQKNIESTNSTSRNLSRTAFTRLFALRNIETQAARAMIKGDTYPDFFVEGSGPPWHEAFEDVISGNRLEFSENRMAYIDFLPKVGGDDGGDGGYSDFFVEGSGPPWHEAFGDVVTGDYLNPRVRIASLQTLNVLQAYARLREVNLK